MTVFTLTHIKIFNLNFFPINFEHNANTYFRNFWLVLDSLCLFSIKKKEFEKKLKNQVFSKKISFFCFF